jgi:tetratricopeptide (TPR) repeat protein
MSEMASWSIRSRNDGRMKWLQGALVALLFIDGGAAHARTTRPTSAAARSFQEGRVRYAAREYDSALTAFRRSYAAERIPAMLVNIGECLHALGRDAEAAQAYRAFLDTRSGSRKLRTAVFEALDRVEAPAAAPRTTKPAGRDAVAALEFQRGRWLYQRKDYAGALDAFSAAYARFPSPALLIDIGHCLRRLDRQDEAIAAFEAFLERDHRDAKRRLEVWRALDDTREHLETRMYRLAEAAAMFQRYAGQLPPDSPLKAELLVTASEVRKLLVDLDSVTSASP